jgi:hypothetical protein
VIGQFVTPARSKGRVPPAGRRPAGVTEVCVIVAVWSAFKPHLIATMIPWRKDRIGSVGPTGKAIGQFRYARANGPAVRSLPARSKGRAPTAFLSPGQTAAATCGRARKCKLSGLRLAHALRVTPGAHTRAPGRTAILIVSERILIMPPGWGWDVVFGSFLQICRAYGASGSAK